LATCPPALGTVVVLRYAYLANDKPRSRRSTTSIRFIPGILLYAAEMYLHFAMLAANLFVVSDPYNGRPRRA